MKIDSKLFLIAMITTLMVSHHAFGYTYQPEGKADPFAPLSLIRPTLAATTKLQQHEVHEFELVGTLFGKEPTALLMTPNPREGIIARVGDRIGRRGGRVVSISRDKLLAREPSSNSIPGQVVQFNDVSIQLSKNKNTAQ